MDSQNFKTSFSDYISGLICEAPAILKDLRNYISYKDPIHIRLKHLPFDCSKIDKIEVKLAVEVTVLAEKVKTRYLLIAVELILDPTA